MPSYADWWDSWLDQHGRDSEEEAAFVGYLSTHSIAHTSPPEDLDAAYDQFKQFMQASAATPSAGPSPAPEPSPPPPQPQSRTAEPHVEKPAEDATRTEHLAPPSEAVRPPADVRPRVHRPAGTAPPPATHDDKK